MTIRLILLFCLLGITAPGGAYAATDTSETTPATAEDIQRLRNTLEDPGQREILIRNLELMMQAEKQAGEPARPVESVFGIARTVAVETWEAIVSVDPRHVLMATLWTIAILVAALLLRWASLLVMGRFYARLVGDHDEADGEPGDQHVGSAELPGTVSRLVNLIIGVLAAALIAESWGAGIGEFLQTNLGSRIAETALAVGLIMVATVALWHASQFIVRRVLSLGTRNMDRGRTARRLETLEPLLTKILQVTISVFSGLLVLSELGVNIGPLLAGAGILGLAVGFGAQTLVKDLITGVTILLEDSATNGDVIEAAGHAGVVEEMRIRVIQLRDLSGNVHLIPYSEVTSIINMTKEFSYYLFDVGVAYREDTDNVCRILADIGKELCSDEAFSEDILEPLEILGVDQFADSAVIIKARIKTKPIRQWAVGREFNRRMKQRFDKEGIEIPFPHTTLYFGEPKEGDAPPALVKLRNAATAG